MMTEAIRTSAMVNPRASVSRCGCACSWSNVTPAEEATVTVIAALFTGF